MSALVCWIEKIRQNTAAYFSADSSGCRRSCRFLCALLAACLALSFPAAAKGRQAGSVQPGAGNVALSQSPAFFKAASYFADGWPIDFWDLEWRHLDEDMARIRADGFRQVVLVLPWRYFQPAPQAGSVNEAAYGRLDRLMEAAQRASLGVILRLGYTWDTYSRDDVTRRYEQLLYSDSVRAAWLDYAGRVYQRCRSHANFAAAFVTWEDFWNFIDYGPRGAGTETQAEASGFAAFARQHYTDAALSAMYRANITGGTRLYLPGPELAARKILYEFYDWFLQGLLADTQQVFPGLSMEARLDLDTVMTPEGSLYGFSHSGQFGAGSAPFSSAMLSVSMGFQAGQQLRSAQALEMSERLLAGVVSGGGKRVFVDQLLYMDNTPDYAHNARLLPQEIGSYIRGMAPVLQRHSAGYAVWTYKNYGDNRLLNPEFFRGEQAWQLEQTVLKQTNGNHSVLLSAGSRLTQQVAPEAGKQYLRFEVLEQGSAQLELALGSFRKKISLPKNGGKVSVEIPAGHAGALFRLSCLSGYAELDNFCLYRTETDGGLYRIDGSPGPYLEDVRALNTALP